MDGELWDPQDVPVIQFENVSMCMAGETRDGAMC